MLICDDNGDGGDGGFGGGGSGGGSGGSGGGGILAVIFTLLDSLFFFLVFFSPTISGLMRFVCAVRRSRF